LNRMVVQFKANPLLAVPAGKRPTGVLWVKCSTGAGACQTMRPGFCGGALAARPICDILFLCGFLTQTIPSRTAGRAPASGRKGAASLRRVDFENGGIVQNILQSAFPMLIAQILNLLYNIVDRV